MTRRAASLILLCLWLLWPVTPVAVLHAEESAPSEAAPAEESAPPDDNAEDAGAEEVDEEAGEESGLAPIEDISMPENQLIQPSPEGMDARTSLDLRNIEVTEALRFLAQKAGMNLAFSKNVQGRVQLLLSDVPIKDIFDILLITNQLAYEKTGDIYYIMTEAEYKERFGRKFSDARQVKVFHLNYAIPDQAFSLLDVLKSEIGRILVDPESGTVLIMDTQANIDRMQEALEGMEKKRSIKVYDLQYAKAVEMETNLKTQLDSKKAGTVTADERTNQLVVETLPGRMDDIDRMVRALDKKTKEVLIDAKIIKVTVTDDLKAEMRWEGFYKNMSQAGEFFVGNHPFSVLARTGRSAVGDFVNIPPTATPTQFSKSELTDNVHVGLIGEDSYETLINFLKTIGETKILSNPKLAVINNQEAKIHVGEKQAYVTTTTTTGQTTTTTAENVTFVDVGIQLNVTPSINEKGYVTMKIRPEVSSVSSFLTTPSGNRIPIIDSSLAETSVMVKDGVSIIIGGLRRDEKVEARRKVPFLGDIPILGAPFNSFSSGTRHTELLVLITPHIIYGDKLIDKGRAIGTEPYTTYVDYPSAGELNKKSEPLKGIPVRAAA